MGLKSPKFREQPLPASRRSVAIGGITMVRHIPHFIFALLIASCAFAQPVITSTEVVNSASFLSQGLPGSGIAQGSIFTIFGTGVGPNTPVQLGPLPLQTSLGGTSVSVTVGGQTVKAYILFAVSYQVNALLPSSTPTGSGTVTVTYNNRTSQPEPVQIVSASFGTYTFNSNGFGQAIATDLNYQVNSIIRTFHPGDWVILWGTGLGAINGDDSNKPPVGNLGSPTVHVGTGSLTPYYAGRSADFPGLDQVAFQIPSGIQGCYVPVAVETNGVVSDAPTIAVSTSGQTCSDSLLGQDMINKLAAGGTVDFGFIQLFAIILRNQSLPTGIFVPDFGQATFSEFTPQTAGLASYGVSSGYCITTNDPDMSPGQLDAGASITLQGQSTATLPQLSPGWGYYYSLFNAGPQFFWSDLKYSVSGAGGAKVGFSALKYGNFQRRCRRPIGGHGIGSGAQHPVFARKSNGRQTLLPGRLPAQLRCAQCRQCRLIIGTRLQGSRIGVLQLHLGKRMIGNAIHQAELLPYRQANHARQSNALLFQVVLCLDQRLLLSL